MQFDKEIEYALKLNDPFDEEFLVILNKKIDVFLDFYDEIKSDYSQR